MVPNTSQVVPGAVVSIVQKSDQPTGRLTSGTVAELLTRGNHPRGIKVRLTSGLVGRVQRMGDATTSSVAVGTSNQFSYTDEQPAVGKPGGRFSYADESEAGRADGTERQARAQRANRFRYADVRVDGEQKEPSRQVDLGAYVREGRKQGGGRARSVDAEEVRAKCPVCGTFEGSEVEVSRHVESHFG